MVAWRVGAPYRLGTTPAPAAMTLHLSVTWSE